MAEITRAKQELPSMLQDQLEQLCSQLHAALGETLVAVVLYGSRAKEECFSPQSSDVNVMVVLTDVSVENLDRIIEPVQEAIRTLRLAPMVLSEQDLRRSTDVFPVKFRDMQRHHCLLWGRDVLQDLVITQDHLRLRCEQEIKNLMIRLRGLYLRRRQLPEVIEHTLCRAISSFLGSLAVLVELKTGQTPARKQDVVEAAAQLGLDVQPLRTALALKCGTLTLDDAALKQLYNGLMCTVSHAADISDQLQEPTR